MKIFITILLSVYINFIYAQSINTEKIAFINFLKRQYEQERYEGVKLIENYDKTYIICILSLSSKMYPSSNTMFRVAKVKATQQIGAYVDGTKISSDLLIRSTESDDSVKVETLEIIREHSNSFIQNVELLTHFYRKDKADITVFIYGKEVGVKRKH